MLASKGNACDLSVRTPAVMSAIQFGCSERRSGVPEESPPANRENPRRRHKLPKWIEDMGRMEDQPRLSEAEEKMLSLVVGGENNSTTFLRELVAEVGKRCGRISESGKRR